VNTTYVYDDAGREITRTVAAGTPIADTTVTTYLDGTNLPETVTIDGNTTTHGYDYRLRLISTTVQPRVGKTLTSTTTYDDIDRVAMSRMPTAERRTTFMT